MEKQPTAGRPKREIERGQRVVPDEEKNRRVVALETFGVAA